MKIFLITLLFIMQVPLMAEIQLSPLFSDGAVLQRHVAVPVWGWAESGTEVTVSFKDQKKSTQADKHGKWMIKLDPMKASAENAVMNIVVGAEAKTIKDILIGEVWLCGGQSNMDFSLLQLSTKAKDAKYQPIADYINNEIETAIDPLLRQIKVQKKVSALEEKHTFNGVWQKLVRSEVSSFTATGYFFARELRQKLGVPVGLLNCNWGGTRVEPWIPMSAFNSNPKLKEYYNKNIMALKNKMATYDSATEKVIFEKKIITWKEARKKAKAESKKVPRRPYLKRNPFTDNRVPAALYNGMTHALVPYALKGAIWYQGESNTQYFPDQYRERFSTLINAWRRAWGQEKLYFYWCQLAQFKKANEQALNNNGWTTVCDQQRLTLELADTGMAVLNDIGEANDIHPKNKIDAGKRLSLWALKQAYGHDLVCSGPLYKSSEIKADKIIVTFSNVGSGLMVATKHLMEPARASTDSLKRFQIRGADNVWKWADAKIISTDSVEVFHKEIAEPKEVRYAWSPNAEGANLYNREGLPASLFKTK
ncbi:MAG: 9-O-acetylesterase [Lentisphaeraceae bacterium]|nr:9-O-acetylesterase [Lentisphaeraceae bacterium]